MTKQSIDFHALGDTCKKFESLTTSNRLMPGVPIIARMDGRAFHTLTRNADKPYDYEFVEAMRNVTQALVKEYNATIGYVQSDEITLVWTDLDMFDLKIQKLCSSLAATTTALFVKAIAGTKFEKVKQIPTFDCRIWNVPSISEAVDALMWRQWDASKNSVSMAAYHMFGNPELEGINTGGKIKKMRAAGFDWDELPDYIQRGTFYVKRTIQKELDEETLLKIPEKHRPDGPVERNVVLELWMPKLTGVSNKVGALFNDEVPKGWW